MSLWHNPDFVKLWAGQTVSKFGTHITAAALSATAVLVLQATPAQMGLLNALSGLPSLALSLLAGVWVDRLRRRPVLIWTDLARGALLASIPLAAWLGQLRIAHLYAVAFGVGALTIVFDVADRAYLPTLLPRAQLLEANSRLGASDSVAEISGPALAGGLVQWLGAPYAILVDSTTYLASALSVGLIHTPEPPPAPPSHHSLWAEINVGLNVLRRDSILRALAGNAATRAFFGNFIGAVYWLLLVREWGLSPAWVGVSIGAGGVGALIGAFTAEQITHRFGVGRTLIASVLISSGLALVPPFARGSPLFLLALMLALQLVGDIPWALHAITSTSLQQAVIPPPLLGRATASLSFLVNGAAPLGALTAGALGGFLGLRGVWLVGALGGLASLLWLWASPVRHLREMPTSMAGGPTHE